MQSLARVVRGFGLLAGASLAGQLIGFLVLAIAARRLGAANIGSWYLAVSIVALASLPVGLGMTTLGTRDIACNPESSRYVVGEVVVTQTLLALVVFLIVVPVSGALVDDALLGTLLLIAGAALFLNASTLEWALLALGRPGWVAWWRLAGQIVYGALGIAFITAGAAGTERYGAFNMIGLGITVAGTWLTLLRLIGRPILTARPRELFRRVRRSLPFGAMLVMVQIYWALGTVLLGLLGSAKAVGLYGVAQRLPMVIIALVLLWVSTMYPHSAALFRKDPAELARQVRVATGTGISLLLPLVVVAPFLGSSIMASFFGPEYRSAGAPFAWLVALAVVSFVSVTFTNVFMAVGGERQFMRYASLGAVLAVVVNVSLIPRFGAIAPALATLAAEALVGILCARRLRSHLGRLTPALGDYRRIVVGLGACLVFVAATAGVAWPIRGGLGVLLYAVLSGVIRFERFVPRLAVPKGT